MTASGNLDAEIAVVSLNNGSPDMGTGQPDNWFAQWTFGGTVYYVRAQYAGGGAPLVGTYGTVTVAPTGTSTHVPMGTATVTEDTTKNIITISVPLSSVGSPATGASLGNVLFETDVQVGSPLYTADSQPALVGYKIGSGGSTCPALPAPAKALPGTVPTQGAQDNLAHYGGPVVRGITNYIIWWLPQTGTTMHPSSSGSGSSTEPCLEPAIKSYNYEPGLPTDPGTDKTYEDIITQYFKDLQGTSFYNLLTQYADQSKGITNNSVSFGGAYVDTCGYSSTPSPGASVPGGTAAAPLYDADIQNEVAAAMKVNGWKPGLGHQYFVFTGYDAASCFGPPSPGAPTPSCSVHGPVPIYCAYHGDYIDPSGNPVLYANMVDGYWAGTQDVGLCYTSPIGTTAGVPHHIGSTTVRDWAADAEVSITSHEEFETVNDPLIGTAQQYAPPLGWYSNPNDQGDGEIGDKCAYIYGKYGSDGANITLQNGDRYIVQLEYSNWANGCSVGDASVAPSPYGGAPHTVTLLKGWNLIDIPTNSGLTTAEKIEDSIEAATPSGSGQENVIAELATFTNGRWKVVLPDYNDMTITRNQGIFVYMSSGPYLWTPPGTPYTSPQAIHLGQGWNLIGATWPNPGVMTDSMFNQIEAQRSACQIDSNFLNPQCLSTVSNITTYGPTFDNSGNQNGGRYLSWRPAPKDANGNPQWPQGVNDSHTGLFQTGNQVPFTNGMWVRATRALTWTPQGTECQTIVNGICQ